MRITFSWMYAPVPSLSVARRSQGLNAAPRLRLQPRPALRTPRQHPVDKRLRAAYNPSVRFGRILAALLALTLWIASGTFPCGASCEPARICPCCRASSVNSRNPLTRSAAMKKCTLRVSAQPDPTPPQAPCDLRRCDQAATMFRARHDSLRTGFEATPRLAAGHAAFLRFLLVSPGLMAAASPGAVVTMDSPSLILRI